MKKSNYFINFFIFFFAMFQLHAQCKIENKAFQSGEKLKYDLYYKYGIINSKAGEATLVTNEVNYRGNRAYKIELKAKTTGLVNTMYTVRDTLVSYLDLDLVPLLFRKGALEGNDYTDERYIYTYKEDEPIRIRTIRNSNGELSFDETVVTSECTYDMVSILAYARSLNYTAMREGQNTGVQLISGKNIKEMYLRYLGTKKQRMNDGKTYDTIQLSLVVIDDAFENKDEAMNIVLTNDANKLPLVIESGLKIGKMRVVLKDFSGNKTPVN